MDNELSLIKKEIFTTIPLLSRTLDLYSIPEIIYHQGTIPNITLDKNGKATPRILTVVGSRKCSTYGKAVVKKLLSSFNHDEVIIVSGLALGIDAVAHEVAIKNNITTIAIPGSGLNERYLYPSSHRSLAKNILESGGCLLSEFPPETRAAKWTFPARNRIMAALADAILIVEAEEKSGTLITARLALELGKEIGAVPGDIFSPTSTGTLSLIKDGATPITSHEDLRDLLGLPTRKTNLTQENILTPHEDSILTLLQEPLHKDDLLDKSGLPLDVFITTLSLLEIKGYIEDTFGEIRKIV